MLYKEKPYKVERVICVRDDCQKTFNVIISSIHTIVDASTAIEGIIDDYVMVRCPCGHCQKIYVKTKQHLL